MLMGGLFGRSVGAFCHTLQVTGSPSGVYAVVESAAMLCGFKQMTLASVLIVVECVNDLSLAPIVMLGVAVSMAVNWSMNERGHDEEVIHRRALPYLEPDAWRCTVRCTVRGPCCPLLPEAPLAQVLSALEEEAHYFPVKEPDGPCLGIASRAAVKSLLPSSSQAEHVQLDSELVEELLPIHRDPTPFTVVEDMPAPRLYSLFAKAGERAACVTSIRGDFRGLISRERLIASRHGRTCRDVSRTCRQAERQSCETLRRAAERRRKEQQQAYEAALDGPAQELATLEGSISEIQHTAELEISSLHQKSEKLRSRTEERPGGQEKLAQSDKEVQDSTAQLTLAKARNRSSVETLQQEKVRKSERLQQENGLALPAEENDQVRLHDFLIARAAQGRAFPMRLDTDCEVFQCMYEEQPQWQVDLSGQKPRLRNQLTQSQPLVAHGNGHTGRWFLSAMYSEMSLAQAML
eukprot:g1440.t1